MTALTAGEKGNIAIPHVPSLGPTITGIRQAEESLVRRDVPVERIHTACTYKRVLTKSSTTRTCSRTGLLKPV